MEEVDQSDKDDNKDLFENIENKSNQLKNDEYFENAIQDPKVKIKDSYLKKYLY